MVNPLAPCFEWFLAFWRCIPGPALSFFGLAFVMFFICSILRWWH